MPEPQYHRHVYVMTLFEAPREGRSNLLIVHPENALCASVYFLAVSHVYVQSCIVLFVPMCLCVALYCLARIVLCCVAYCNEGYHGQSRTGPKRTGHILLIWLRCDF